MWPVTAPDRSWIILAQILIYECFFEFPVIDSFSLGIVLSFILVDHLAARAGAKSPVPAGETPFVAFISGMEIAS
jgi:hypothetical protein